MKISTSYVIRKYNLKQLWDTSIHLLEGQNPEHKHCQILVTMCRIKTLIHCQWEYKMEQPLWKTSWQFLRKRNTLLPYSPIILLLGIYPKEFNDLGLHKNLSTDTSFMHNCQNLEVTYMFFHKWMDKLWYIWNGLKLNKNHSGRTKASAKLNIKVVFFLPSANLPSSLLSLSFQEGANPQDKRKASSM